MELLSLQKVAKHTDTSVGFWRKQVFMRQIPVVKVGRLVRLRAEDVASWVADRTHPTRTKAKKMEKMQNETFISTAPKV